MPFKPIHNISVFLDFPREAVGAADMPFVDDARGGTMTRVRVYTDRAAGGPQTYDDWYRRSQNILAFLTPLPQIAVLRRVLYRNTQWITNTEVDEMAAPLATEPLPVNIGAPAIGYQPTGCVSVRFRYDLGSERHLVENAGRATTRTYMPNVKVFGTLWWLAAMMDTGLDRKFLQPETFRNHMFHLVVRGPGVVEVSIPIGAFSGGFLNDRAFAATCARGGEENPNLTLLISQMLQQIAALVHPASLSLVNEAVPMAGVMWQPEISIDTLREFAEICNENVWLRRFADTVSIPTADQRLDQMYTAASKAVNFLNLSEEERAQSATDYLIRHERAPEVAELVNQPLRRDFYFTPVRG